MSDTQPARKWGGARPGAGRKPKNRGALPDLDIAHALAAPVPAEIETVAQRYVASSLAALVKVLMSGANESARINAAKELLDRGYGKPAVDIGGFAQLPLFGGVSMKPIGGEIRAEARRYAHLAIEALRKIADDGRSEGARVAAARALLDRGLGTVAPAKLDEAPRVQPPAGVEAERAASKWDGLVH